MNIDAYIKSANRGDFQWYPLDTDDYSGKVIAESCRYKGVAISVVVAENCGIFEVTIDLNHEPFFISQYRSNRRLARELTERIYLNDCGDNYNKNFRYIDK